ncbi:MAG TPA: hypothetical protein VEC16_05480 [Alphaproteobacteria bacterium]|nr:hypothetical protein [Alphaproteobacteria bacterium]
MTIDDKFIDDELSNEDSDKLWELIIANAVDNFKNHLSPAEKALYKLIRRLEWESKYFVSIFAREEFDDKETRKRFRSDSAFREKYLDDKFKETAGEGVYDESIRLFEDYTSARQWYFSNIPSLRYGRPYNYCKKGDTKTISDLLGRIEHGIY